MGTPAKHTDAQLRRVLGKMSDGEAAERLGLAVNTCLYHRRRLGIATCLPHSRTWAKRELKLLGSMPDGHLAEKLGCTRKHVFEMRKRHGVPAFDRYAKA